MTARAIQLGRTAVLTIAHIAVLALLLVVGTALVPVIPWFRLYAFDVIPNRAPWFLVGSFALLVLAIAIDRRRSTGMTIALVLLSSATLLLVTKVVADFLAVARTNAADIRFLDTFSSRDYSADAKPDESRIYSSPGGEALWLDIYRPRVRADGPGSPALIFVHGGGFAEGTRRIGAANLRAYADRGWTVFSVDYRLARADRPTWNLAVEDVRCSLSYIVRHARELGVDVTRVAINGASAGGSLAIATAYSADAAPRNARCGSSMPRIAAVIARAPLIDPLGSWYNPGELQPVQRRYMTQYIGGSPDRYPDRYAAVDMRRYLGPSNPPTLLLAGSDDPLLPLATIQDFARQLSRRGSASKLVVFPYSGHDFNTTFDSINNQTLRQTVAAFLRQNGVAPTDPATSGAIAQR